MDTLKRIVPQMYPTPGPSLTEFNLPPQPGKVVLITGASAGIGFELSRIFFDAGARVYMAARSPSKAETAITQIKNAHPHPKVSGGSLVFLKLDYADLATVKPCVEEFLSKETTLDVLFNNAGIASVPATERTNHGLEPHIQVNCIGGYLLTRLLSPALEKSARNAAPGSVRVIFTSMLVDAVAPNEGVPPDDLDTPSMDANRNYSISKTGNWFLAVQYSKVLGPKGVLVLTQNPGNLRTAIFDGAPRFVYWLSLPLLWESVDGANTSLWSGFSADVTADDGGRYVLPWGKWHHGHRPEHLDAIKDKSEGGKGYAKHFFEWCDLKSKDFQ